MQARARLLKERDTEKMALGQEADEGGGSQVSTQLHMIGLRQQVDATRKEFDEASAQIRRLQKQNNTLLQRMASSQRALGEQQQASAWSQTHDYILHPLNHRHFFVGG